MEITLNRQSFKKALGVFLVVALFFGMCSPAAPFLPKVSFEVGAISDNVVTSGNCGYPRGFMLGGYESNATFVFYSDGTLIVSGYGEIGGRYNLFIPGYYSRPFESIYLSIKNVIINEGITSIGCGAFYNCKNLESIDIPNSVTKIGYGAFYNCTSLKSIEIPDSVTEFFCDDDWIDYCKVFYNCTSLESVKLSANMEELPTYLFDGCTSLKNVVLPATLKVLPEGIFRNCTSLELIEIPDSVTGIQDYAFIDCSSLKSIVIPDGVTEIDDSAFSGCTNLESVDFSEKLEFIGTGAFNDCYFLKKADIPSTVKTIGSSAFNNCIYLEEITIPESVTSIGQGAFTNCIRLSKVTIMNPDCEIRYEKEIIPEKAIIYGYSGSTAEKYATDWMRKFVPLDREHDHEFESKVTLKPTCTSTGVETFTCYCGETYTEVIVPNSHFDFDFDGNCDMCDAKFNSGGETETPDEGGTTTPDGDGNGTTEAPGDSGSAQEPEEEKNVFEKFFESLIEFFKNFANLFDYFKDMF